MTMSKGHFKATMTRGTQADQVIKDISLVLKFKIAATLDVMHVKLSTAWAMVCAAVVANLVAFDDLQPDIFPVATARQLFAASPVGAIVANHMRNRAFSGAEFAPMFDRRREGSELFTAVFARRNGVLSCANGLTFAAAILGARMNGGLTADKTNGSFGDLATIRNVTFARAKAIDNRPRSVSMVWPFKLFTTV